MFKKCMTCKLERPVTDYRKRTKSKDGLQYTCIHCHAEYFARPEIKEMKRARHIERRYGLTRDLRNKIAEEQDHKCPICESSSIKHVDHDHSCCSGDKTCGKCIRGILCHGCNIKLGVLEQPEWVAKAQRYLDSYKQSGDATNGDSRELIPG